MAQDVQRLDMTDDPTRAREAASWIIESLSAIVMV